jgi:membrane protein CcdC involved in cytochrome C biogenesis
MDVDVYRTARSTRPAWANALIVAALLVIAGIVMYFVSVLPVAGWFFIAAVVALLVAGVLALTGVSRKTSA